jgi:hypothetical protein
MLDLSNLQSQHIFAASRLEDSFLAAAKSIIAAPATERQEPEAQAERTLDSMRALNKEHFGDSRFISEGIDGLQQALRSLAEADQPRLDVIMPALTRLRSAEGFCTEFI